MFVALRPALFHGARAPLLLAAVAGRRLRSDHSDDWLREMRFGRRGARGRRRSSGPSRGLRKSLRSMGQHTTPQADAREVAVVPPRTKEHLVHIHATSNNTVVTVTAPNGNTLNWASAGSVGFKGAKRSTAFAAQTAGTKAAQARGGAGASSFGGPCFVWARGVRACKARGGSPPSMASSFAFFLSNRWRWRRA